MDARQLLNIVKKKITYRIVLVILVVVFAIIYYFPTTVEYDIQMVPNDGATGTIDISFSVSVSRRILKEDVVRGTVTADGLIYTIVPSATQVEIKDVAYLKTASWLDDNRHPSDSSIIIFAKHNDLSLTLYLMPFYDDIEIIFDDEHRYPISHYQARFHDLQTHT